MRLNTLAGRSYNDLTQYPVMPWVLRDYTSGRSLPTCSPCSLLPPTPPPSLTPDSTTTLPPPTLLTSPLPTSTRLLPTALYHSAPPTLSLPPFRSLSPSAPLTPAPTLPTESLDLESRESRSRVFRDLSKPIGAQEPERAAKFAERFASYEDAVSPSPFSPPHLNQCEGAILKLRFLFSLLLLSPSPLPPLLLFILYSSPPLPTLSPLPSSLLLSSSRKEPPPSSQTSVLTLTHPLLSIATLSRASSSAAPTPYPPPPLCSYLPSSSLLSYRAHPSSSFSSISLPPAASSPSLSLPSRFS